MSSRGVTIGEFARMTHLTTKALRHYDREGVLRPARVDPVTGYRYYDPDQTATAQLVRRLRSLDLPVEQVRAVLLATDDRERDALLAEHLSRMEFELDRRRDTVASLRRLLDPAGRPDVAVEQVHRPAVSVLAISDTIDLDDLDRWWVEAFGELDAVVTDAGLVTTGHRGGLYSAALLAGGRGELSVVRPVAVSDEQAVLGGRGGRVRAEVLPAADLAVAVHDGHDLDIDLVYAALGRHVDEHGLAAPGPVRETYLSPLDATVRVTEIGWPVQGPRVA